ncbi:MAG TPA: VanZ family protein [Bacteroidales bacterium]|nr:VanZ family protein [Bacteroidales bacterium]
MNHLTKYLPFLFWTYVLILAIFNLKPGNPGTTQEMGEILFVRRDYFLHVVAFMALAGLYSLAARTSYPIFRKHDRLFGAVFLIGLATALEAFQYFIPERKFNWYDLLANQVGLLFGAFLIAMIVRVPFVWKQDQFINNE